MLVFTNKDRSPRPIDSDGAFWQWFMDKDSGRIRKDIEENDEKKYGENRTQKWCDELGPILDEKKKTTEELKKAESEYNDALVKNTSKKELKKLHADLVKAKTRAYKADQAFADHVFTSTY